MSAIFRWALAVIAGAMSGFLVYMGISLLVADSGGADHPVWILFVFWPLSAFVLARNAPSVSNVIKRSFLLGSAEWMLMIPVGVILAGKAATEATGGNPTDMEMAGAAVGFGLISFLTGGVAIAMCGLCLLGYLITFLMTREMQTKENPT